MTVVLAVVAMLVSMVVGLVLCVAVMARAKLVSYPARLLIEFGRNTPIIVQLIWVHYALPDLIGVKFRPFESALIALALADQRLPCRGISRRLAVDRSGPGRGGAVAWE